MPGLSTIYKWMRDDKDFSEQVTEARRTGAQTWLDTAMEILDREDIPPQQMQLVREKLHHIRFVASKLISLYSDKQEIKQTGDSSLTIKWEMPNLPSSEQQRTVTGTQVGVQKLDTTKVQNN